MNDMSSSVLNVSSGELDALLERVRRGESLATSDRLRALELLEERYGMCSAAQLARLLGASERQIYRDRRMLRKRYAELARQLDIVGEGYRQFKISLSMIDARLASGALSEKERILYLRERRELIFGFLDRLTAFRLEDALRKLRVSTNGHQNNAVTLSSN